MKRSEIIDIIINEICNHEPISRKNKNIEFASEWILKKMEEAGMLPPFNSNRVSPENVMIVDGKVYPGQAKWEQE